MNGSNLLPKQKQDRSPHVVQVKTKQNLLLKFISKQSDHSRAAYHQKQKSLVTPHIFNVSNGPETQPNCKGRVNQIYQLYNAPLSSKTSGIQSKMPKQKNILEQFSLNNKGSRGARAHHQTYVNSPSRDLQVKLANFHQQEQEQFALLNQKFQTKDRIVYNYSQV